MYVKDVESVQMVLLLESIVARKRVAVVCMTSAVWDVMFEEKKGRSDGLELNQTLSRTLLLDRRCITLHSDFVRGVGYEHTFLSKGHRLDIRYYITLQAAGTNQFCH